MNKTKKFQNHKESESGLKGHLDGTMRLAAVVDCYIPVK